MKPATFRFVEFEGISAPTSALTDASSLRELAEHASTLSAPLNPALAQQILNDLDGFALLPALSLLERWLVVDTVLVDVVAVASTDPRHRIARSWRSEEEPTAYIFGKPETSPIDHLRRRILEDRDSPEDDWLATIRRVALDLSIAFTSIPPTVFTRCLDLLARTSRALRAAQPGIPWGSYGFGPEKEYGEALGDIYGDSAHLARSHLGVERTLVYYEAAAAARVPLVLHPARFEEVEAIDRASRDAYSVVKKQLYESFEEPVRRQLDALGLTETVQCPALVSKLVVEAGRQNTSIISAAREMKASRAAGAFRKWLSDIQECLGEGTIGGGHLEALRMLRELKNVAERWSEELDVGLGVRYKRRQLRLSWVPRIGGLLEMLEMPKVKDPILNRKGYLTFMSSWFER